MKLKSKNIAIGEIKLHTSRMIKKITDLYSDKNKIEDDGKMFLKHIQNKYNLPKK